jgi:flagellar biosynthesis component FlhA
MINPVHMMIAALVMGVLSAATHQAFVSILIMAALLAVVVFWVNRSSFKRIMDDAPGEAMRVAEWPTIGAVIAIIATQFVIALALLSVTYWPARLLVWPQHS